MPETTIPEKDLHKAIENLNANIVHLTEAVEKKNADHSEKPAEHKEEGKKTSKVAVTGGLALLGFKIGGLVGAKVGFLYNMFKNKNMVGDADDLKQLGNVFNKQIRQVTIGGLIGGAIGTVVLGAIGWKRGDRIKDPGDLLKHPLESLGKIFSNSEPNGKKVDDKKQLPIVHNGSENNTSWQDKVGREAVNSEARTI
jgi:hypothetical protein